MAHKTLINGTAYEIDGGKAMVDGAVYEIDHGVANVDGTAYEVGFAPPMVTVILSGKTYSSGPMNFWSGDATAKINGVEYAPMDGVNGNLIPNTPTTLEVPIGTEIVLHAKNTIQLNGSNLGTKDYTYTVKGNVTILLRIETKQNGPGMYGNFGYVYITEIPEGHELVTITGSGLFVGNVAAYVIIEGVQYTESASVVVPTGTVIPCTVIANSGYAYVYLNGTVVASVNENSYENFTTYNYTLKGNVTIELSVSKGSGGVRITET